ncbi:SLAC1 family transporter [Dactylosporangium darangshiense]|uniref:C4-dicarboxylate transporter/malic acid transport protein n=1 Tax=Dactylosporangium darangshiense TaxID=579108 RepID=A0ABP8CY81_9ACTN
MNARTSESPVGITPNLFGIAYGLTGLAGCWGYAALLHLAPAVVSDILCLLAAVVWLTLLVSYVMQVQRRPGGWHAELTHPVLAPFVSLIPIVGMLLSIGLMRHDRATGQWLFGVFAIVTVVLAGWMTGQWIAGGLDLDKLHPGYVLPAVAGGLIATIGASLAGWSGLARVFFGLGLVSWLVVESMILARLYFRPPLPPQLQPTLAIEAAPPALAGLAYLAITHGKVDAVAFGLAGYTLLAALIQLRLVGVYRHLHFTSGFWAFAFPYAAVATFTLHWVVYAHPPGYRIWAWVVILAITAFVAALAAETTAALARHRFLPQLH